jgi:hypothetical protein
MRIIVFWDKATCCLWIPAIRRNILLPPSGYKYQFSKVADYVREVVKAGSGGQGCPVTAKDYESTNLLSKIYAKRQHCTRIRGFELKSQSSHSRPWP